MDEFERNKMPDEAVLGTAELAPATPIGKAEAELRDKLMQSAKRALELERAFAGIPDPAATMKEVREVVAEMRNAMWADNPADGWKEIIDRADALLAKLGGE